MADSYRVLVVDDEAVQRELMAGFLRKHGLDVALAASGGDALQRFRQEPFDLVLTDQKMPDLSGVELLAAVRAINPEVAVIVVTAYGTIETAVNAIKAGAADYLAKPVNLDELLHRIHQVRERQQLRHENRELRLALVERHRVEGIIGESGQMQEVLSLVKRVAPSDATVLIRGESGTGKELIARAIHHASPRAAGPSSRSTAPRSPRASSSPSCSATRRAPSLARPPPAKGALSWRTAGALSRRDRRPAVAPAGEAAARAAGA